ncbi:MAG TPA: HDIG domain-containing protein [Geobacteraceae bacterium]|nr:HDIG domain-containing protein [Geobacteraceae bacterium]
MNTISLLKKYFAQNNGAFDIVYEHSSMVAVKALQIAESLRGVQLDLRFIEDAALLHDIGVSRTFAPKIGCHGEAPYLHHGIIGREILETEGLHAHGLVCERHIGVGLTVEDIVAQQLSIPVRDMIPITLEEKIICFADLFYSKRPGLLRMEKTVDQVRNNLSRHGAHKVEIFEKWRREFNC